MPHKRSVSGLQSKRVRDIKEGFVKARNSTELQFVLAPSAVANRTATIARALAAHRQLELINAVHDDLSSAALCRAFENNRITIGESETFRAIFSRGNAARHKKFYTTPAGVRDQIEPLPATATPSLGVRPSVETKPSEEK